MSQRAATVPTTRDDATSPDERSRVPLDASSTMARSPPVWRQRLRRWAAPALGLLVLAMLASRAHEIDWSGAWKALRSYQWAVLLMVLGVALASHALYACFDLIGRHHTRHGLGRLHTWAIALASYAFNLNLGSLVGGVALRARLYARAGLDEATVAQIVGLSMATNWSGYGVVAGVLFASGLIAPPGESHLSAGALRMAGVAMILLAMGYVVGCAFARGRAWRIRGRNVRLPAPRVAVIQLVVSGVNWALMGGAMALLLDGAVPYATTLAVLMAAAIAGVVTPIPAGLGVIEAVYLALLGGTVPQGRLMGAVLAYRALYYLVPLAIGIVLYVALERAASRRRAGNQAGADPGGDPRPKTDGEDASGGFSAARGSPARNRDPRQMA